MMQQHIGCAGRVWSKGGADDRRSSGKALPPRRLEIFVEEITDRHGPEADDFIHLLLAHAAELAADLQQALEIIALAPGIDLVLREWVEPRGIGRRHHQERLDEAALPADLGGIVIIGLGILDRMPAQ